MSQIQGTNEERIAWCKCCCLPHTWVLNTFLLPPSPSPLWPFFSSQYGVASFVASCVFFVFRVGGRSRGEGDPESTSFALKNKDFAVLAVLTCAYHIFFALALDELYLTAGRVIVSEGLDLFIAFLFSCCIIRRSYKRPWRVIMALLLTIAGVGLFWLVTWNSASCSSSCPPLSCPSFVCGRLSLCCFLR